MAFTTSPLRYPGGKTCLLKTVSTILRLNKLQRQNYAEPYAGGCGLALGLLYGGHVCDIHINDIDRSIWSFWYSILNDTDDFIHKINETPVTLETWYEQRKIQENFLNENIFSLGFATFFLNRTNRSGIIKKAGVIGGISQQGEYKIDCRFNKENLIDRIKRIKKYADRIHLYNMDALKFLNQSKKRLPTNTFFCIDPPYYKKGSSLYTSFYKPSDHEKLSKLAIKLNRPWIITYDNASEIRDLYSTRRQFEFSLNYSLQKKRVGTEVMVASKGLRMPEDIRAHQINRPKVKAA